MNLTEIIRTATANAFRSRVRTVLTVLAIFVGAFTLTLTNGAGTGITRYIDSQVASFGASDTMMITQASLAESGTFGAPDSGPAVYDPERAVLAGGMGSQFEALTQKDLDNILGIRGVISAEPLRLASPDYISGPSGTMYEFTVNPSPGSPGISLSAGNPISRGAEGLSLLVPESYSEPLGFSSPGEAVGATVTIGVSDMFGERHEITAEIAGVQEDTIMAFGMIISEGLAEELYAAQLTGVPAELADAWPMVTAELEPGLDDTEIDSIKSALAEAGYTGSTMKDRMGVIDTVISAIVMVLNAFAVIALIAAGFGIINTLLMSVQERTREIGLMKAMGMSSGKVFALFSAEAAVIGFLGSAIGSVLAILLGSAISSGLATGPLADLAGLRVLQFDPVTVLSVIGAVMVLAFVSGTLPAVSAARLHPIDALRYE